MQAALGVSTRLDPEEAGREAAEIAAERLRGSGCELAVLLCSAAHGRGVSRVVDAARAVVGRRLVGASVEGIVAPGIEVSGYPAVLALLLGGVRAEPFLLHDVARHEDRAGEELVARVGRPGPGDLVVVLADSHSVDMGGLARSLPGALDGATLLGTGAAPVPRGRPLLWCGREQASDAVAGWLLGDARPRVSILAMVRPVTPLLAVTRARGNWVLGLGGRPALDVYEEAARRRGLEVVPGAPPPLLAGIAGPGGETGDCLVRNVVGLDPERRAFALPEPMFSGQGIALAEPDPAAARADMARRFEALSRPAPTFGLYLNCRARGSALFGEAGIEARELANAFADCPVAGVSGPFQLASLAPGQPPSLLTYAGALALIGGGSCPGVG